MFHVKRFLVQENETRIGVGVERSGPQHAKAEMALEGIEVAVAMKKVMALSDTKGRDDGVDGAARRHPARSERAMIPRGSNRDFSGHP